MLLNLSRWTTCRVVNFPKGFLFQLLQVKGYCNAPVWSHKGKLGVDNWHKLYPDAKGSSQSPIALYSDATHKALPLEIHGYHQSADFTAYNIGFTAQFKRNHTKGVVSPCYISGVHGWQRKYMFNHLHLHWGETSMEGSEHTIDDRRYPMELHMVHCLDDMSLAEASKHPKGIAVVGFMYEIDSADNLAYSSLLEAAKHITYKGDETKVKEKMSLASLLPQKLNSGYFYYGGSLTTPPCTEVVHWLVFSDPIPISEQQMEVLRTLRSCTGAGCTQFMSGNWRPLQEVNQRRVYQTTHPPLDKME